jgi:hypothetical protein
MVDRAGFRFAKVRPHMLGRDPKDWTGYVELQAPALPDLGEVVSLGDRYLLSVGAHAMHGTLLMAREPVEPLTVEASLASCALLTFALDAPVVPVPSHDNLDALNSRPFSRSLRGTGFGSISEYGEKLTELAELADVFLHPGLAPRQQVHRTIMNRASRSGYWPYYSWPARSDIWRAMSAYWIGTLSIVAPSRILNFWRAIEAVASRNERESLFSSLPNGKVAPVWTSIVQVPIRKHRRREIDATRPQRRLALARRAELIGTHGSPAAALAYLVAQGRGKAAHADQMSLEYDLASELGAQLQDAELIRYMARVAIEGLWRGSA